MPHPDRHEALIDRQAIVDVLIAYCDALDRMDLDRLSTLFTDDCRVAYGPNEKLVSHGSAALRASLARMWRWARTSHHLSNIVVEFDDADHASASSYVLAWHERPDGSTATVYGQYRDRLLRAPSGWRISERTMLENGSDAGFTLELNRLERRTAPEGWVAPDLDDVGGR
ncbi:MAG: nuclear transport factor 2 family protein [Pseudomonadota bacterium]